MPVCITLDLISFVAQPCVLYLAESLLYQSVYIFVRIFLGGGRRVVEVGLMETVFQQLLNVFAVLIKPIFLVERPRISVAVS